MKVKDLPYKRFEIEEAEAVLKNSTEKVRNASSPKEVIEAHKKVLEAISQFNTMGSLAHMRFTLNSFDEFYDKEREYYDNISPMFTELMNDFGKAMLKSPFKEELQKSISPLVFKKYEILAAASDPRIIEDKQKEAEYVARYNKLMAEMSFEFDGKEMTLAELKGYLAESDRNVRKAACEAIGRGLGKHSKELDEIFDNLVKVRDKMAKKLGYRDYVELGYLNMERMDYDREMVEKFRRSVVTDLVPVIVDIKNQLAQKLGIKDYMFYDDAVCFTDGEPKPIIGKDEIFRQAQLMYDEMSPEIGKFMKSMIETEAFDVDARKGKWGGGYCTAFDNYKQTFILANFNGSSDDIDVITHEFGHALAMDMAMRFGDKELSTGGMETAESHSMSMEFLSWPQMGRFFGNDANKYRYKHLLSSLSFIPYGSIVDEFQHIVYSHPELTPKQRNEEYLKLEKKYRPYLSFEGIPYLSEGTRWQYQMHIFETPFYYIDYCLAQTIALGFLIASRENYKDALTRYLEFCRAGGTILFSNLCKRAGLASPFEDGALKKIAEQIPEVLKELE